jgi:hypothetical protein
VQIGLKPASETVGLHRVFIRGKGLKYAIVDSAFKRMQVDARVDMIKLTEARKITPYVWVHPDDDRVRSAAAARASRCNLFGLCFFIAPI